MILIEPSEFGVNATEDLIVQQFVPRNSVVY